MVVTFSHAKVQGQWSVRSEDRMETNGQTDGGDCITSLANAVGNHSLKLQSHCSVNQKNGGSTFALEKHARFL